MKEIERALREEGFRGALLRDEPMGRHCSLAVGGPAALLAEPVDAPDLALLLELLSRRKRPWVVLGGGTNIMFGNGGYPGCAVRLGRGFSQVASAGKGKVEVGSAFLTASLLAHCVREGLAGFEFAAGIPGTVGGALRMNAGTREGDMSRVTEALRLQDPEGERWVQRPGLGFAYRSLALPERSVITAARLSFDLGDPEAVRQRVQGILERRRRTQPLGAPSAGCWFRNPPGDSAGRLIDAAGLKGRRVGGAQVSELHANFLINRGNAVAADFKELALQIRNEVRERFGILLEEEVQVVG